VITVQGVWLLTSAPAVLRCSRAPLFPQPDTADAADTLGPGGCRQRHGDGGAAAQPAVIGAAPAGPRLPGKSCPVQHPASTHTAAFSNQHHHVPDACRCAGTGLSLGNLHFGNKPGVYDTSCPKALKAGAKLPHSHVLMIDVLCCAGRLHEGSVGAAVPHKSETAVLGSVHSGRRRLRCRSHGKA
jgi:hypothetical protein